MIDRYKILETLGEGGSGSVCKAWDTKLQRHVAVKSLLPAGQRDAAAGENLAAEAAALSALQHPNIVSVYDLDTDGEEPFVVMEHINGETLETTVRRGALLEDDFHRVAQETLEGLIAAHKFGICHRDLKPSNIMFHWLPDGKWQVKLLDFGLAQFSVRPAQQQAGSDGKVGGSVHFMAPEQFLHQPLDARSDLYSLGCVLYYALTGCYPSTGNTVEEVMNAHLSRQIIPLHQLRPEMPGLQTDWIMWLMCRQPEERPESAAEALRVLRGVLSGELTSIPASRMLKTKGVKGAATTVVAAPLSKDTGARKAASVSTAKVRPSHAATPGGEEHAAAAEKSKLPLIAGLTAAALGIGGAVFFLTRDNDNQPPGNNPAGAPAPAPAPAAGDTLPQDGLIAWFDAARGLLTESGSIPAAPGDRVDQWDDSAPLAGNNPAQYHTTVADAEEKALRRPHVTALNSSFGLKGSHQVLEFRGENCLIFGRDRDAVGAPIGDNLSGDQLTWIGVFNCTGELRQTLVSAGAGREFRAWDTFTEKGEILSGVREPGGSEHHARLPFNQSNGYHIAVTVWDRGKLQLFLTTPDGKTTSATAAGGPAHSDIDKIRLGAMNARTGPPNHFLSGGIATFAIYQRALTDAEREAAVDYLCRRYFGRPALR